MDIKDIKAIEAKRAALVQESNELKANKAVIESKIEDFRKRLNIEPDEDAIKAALEDVTGKLEKAQQELTKMLASLESLSPAPSASGDFSE